MGKARKALENFIDEIPKAKLTGFPSSAGTIYRNEDFRLDMQGITSNGEFNLQIQANNKPKTTSVKKIAPATVAGPVLIRANANITAEEVRQKFRGKMLI